MKDTSPDFSRLAVHTFTNKPWSLAECITHYERKGIPAMSVWRNLIDPEQGGIGLSEAAKRIQDSALAVPALVRGGFFPGTTVEDRQQAIDANKSYIDEAQAIGADMVVLVVGAVPGMPLPEARRQVQEGIAAIAGHADQAGVRLAIEPLHPMYAGDKSCVNRMAEAREICEALQHPRVGIAADVYHIWWDPDVETELRLSAEQYTLFGFHICDWRINTRHLLTDRGLMGDGCIAVRHLRQLVESIGFKGYHEVEVFSEDYWAMDQHAYLDLIIDRYNTQS
jgi:sugar phosphate isomerase/epimerase